MGKINVCFRSPIRAWWAFITLACFSLASHATTTADYAFERFMQQSTGNGSQTVGLGSNGLPLSSPTKPTITADGGHLRVNQAGQFKNPSGAAVPVSATGRIPPAKVAGSIGRFLKSAAPVGYWIGVGYAGYELARELGFFPIADGVGGVSWQTPDPQICSEAPCYRWIDNNIPGMPSESSMQAACNSSAVLRFGAGHYGVLNPAPSCNWYSSTGQWRGSGGVSRITVSPSPHPVYLPSSQEQFLAEINGRQTWFFDEKIARVLNDAGKAGIKTEVGPLTVIGAPTSEGAKVTKINSDNTTTTSTQTYHHTYEGNKVSTTSTTVINITNTATGAPISSETVTETPPEEKTKFCEDNPSSLACAEVDQPEGEISRSQENISYTPQILFGSGSCPADLSAHIGTLGQTVKVWDWQKTCEMALPLRALVMALAAFAALLIVMPGGAKS